MGERKNTEAKISVGFWNVLSSVWVSLADDHDTLSRTYLSHNFAGILTETFNQATTKISSKDNVKIQSLVDEISTAMEAISKSNLWFKLPLDSTISLILSYTKLYIHANRNTTIQLSFEKSSLLIKKFLKSTLTGSDLKKFSAAFNEKILSHVFVLIGMDLDTYSKDLYNFLVSTLIATPDKKATEIDLAPAQSAVNEYKLTDEEKHKSSIALYEILVVTLPTRSDSAFSQLRKIAPSALKTLVSISSSKKIKLDSDFLKSTMSQIFDKKKESVDWQLLSFIHNIDESFLTERSHLSVILATTTSNKENSKEFHAFAKSFIDYFTNSRELPQFILSWKKHLVPNSCWYNDFISEYLSIQVRTLSNIQLKSLLNTLVHPLTLENPNETPDQLYQPLIVCVLSFFQQRTLPHSMLFDPLFTALQSKVNITSSEFWTLKYLILSISSGFVQKFHALIVSQAQSIDYGLDKKNVNDSLAIGVMQSLFRIAEYIEFSEFENYVSKLIKYIGKKSKSPEIFFETMCDRWLILINIRLRKKYKERLIGLFATNKNAFNKLCSTELFFEQGSLSPLALQTLADKKELKNELLRIKIISSMPLQVIRGSSRKELLNNLSDLALSEKNLKASDETLEFQLTARAAIDHLLSHPSSTVTLVSDSAALQKYFYSAFSFGNHELETLTRASCEKIINYNIKTQKEREEGAKFIFALVNEAVSSLKKTKKHSNNFEQLEFATLIVSLVHSENLQESGLDNVILKSLTKILQTTKGADKSLNDALHAIQNLAILSTTKTNELSKSPEIFAVTGTYATLALKKLVEPQDGKERAIFKNLAASCFTVLTHLSSTKDQVEACLAYYISLLEQEVGVSNNDVVACLQQLEEADFNFLFNETIGSLFDPESAKPFAYITAVTAFPRALKDEENVAASTNVTELLTNVIKNCDKLSEGDLLSYLSFVEYMVKDRPRLLTQFCLDIIISTFVRICTSDFGPSFTPKSDIDSIYAQLASVASSVVVFNRSRLNGRYHLLTQLLTSLLGCLTNTDSNCTSNFQPRWVVNSSKPLGEKAADAYTRLISNLSSTVISYRETSERYKLSSYAQMLKKHLSIYIGVVLINYVRFSLQEGFTPSVRRGLVPGFYMVFNTIGSEQLKNVNLLLDSNSRPYFKTLYEDYMTYGKWKSE